MFRHEYVLYSTVVLEYWGKQQKMTLRPLYLDFV